MKRHPAGLLLIIFAVLSFLPTQLVSAASSNSWAEVTSMQVARSGLAVAVVDSKIYAIGGDARYGEWPYSGSIVGTNEEYNPTTDTWTPKASMPTARSLFAIAIYADKIYCFGGIGASDRHLKVGKTKQPCLPRDGDYRQMS
jgi:hypothetical protein